MTANILCVDDDVRMLSAYQLLEHHHGPAYTPFHVETAPGGAEGLATISSRGPFAVIISDMNMPAMSGIQFLSRARQLAPDSVRMMLTGRTDLQVAIEAVNEGNIFRFLTKPCLPNVLLKAIAARIEQYRLITAERELVEKTLAGSIKALMEVLSLVNPMAFGHASRVQRLARRLAAALNVEKPWQVEMAAALSQVGCVSVPQDILKKVYMGVRLTRQEESMVDSHPRVGHDLIANIPRLEDVATFVAYQEERFDGAGPHHKRGTDIPLGARILKVALDFDNLESKDFPRPTLWNGSSNAPACMILRSSTPWAGSSKVKKTGKRNKSDYRICSALYRNRKPFGNRRRPEREVCSTASPA